jgi:hypothetical protein
VSRLYHEAAAECKGAVELDCFAADALTHPSLLSRETSVTAPKKCIYSRESTEADDGQILAIDSENGLMKQHDRA